MPATVNRHRFSVADYERMTEVGILGKYNRVELIRGEILIKPKATDLHVGISLRNTNYFTNQFGNRAIIGIHNPIRLADSEPEPDVSLLRLRDDFYASGKPRASDLFLVVEIADTSLELDRDIKGPLYAENGVAEYWIVNLIDDCVEVHRQPQGGTYRDVQTARRSDSIELSSLGETIPVTSIFGGKP